MKLITNTDGVYSVVFKTQKDTDGEVSLGTTSLSEATLIAEAMHVKDLETVSNIADLTHQVVTQIVAGKKISVKDAVQMWLNHVTTHRTLSPTTCRANHIFLTAWMRDMNVADEMLSAVKSEAIINHVNRGDERRSSAVRKLAAIRSFFKFCQEEGLVYRNPAGTSLVKVSYDAFNHEEKETKEKGTFTDGEITRLVEAADGDFWKAAIIIARETGLRLGDIAALEWSSFKDGRLVVWTDKANKRIDIEVNEAIQSALSNISETDIQFVFPDARAIIISPERRSLLSTQFARLCKKAGVEGKSFHSLRHTNATGLVQSGSSLEVVAERLGHSSTTTTQGYVHA